MVFQQSQNQNLKQMLAHDISCNTSRSKKSLNPLMDILDELSVSESLIKNLIILQQHPT